MEDSPALLLIVLIGMAWAVRGGCQVVRMDSQVRILVQDFRSGALFVACEHAQLSWPRWTCADWTAAECEGLGWKERP